jgi:membrane glycosyltransferase
MSYLRIPLWTICVVLALTIGVHAQVNVFTPQHVAKLRVVTEAVIAPDGTQVAYVLAVPRDLPREKDGGCDRHPAR